MEDRLQRIEDDMREMRAEFKEMRADISDIKTTLAELAATFSATLPHLATKEELEKVRHESTKGKYGLVVGGLSFLLSLGAIASRWLVE